MAFFTCLWMRQRVAPYLDGALSERLSRAVAGHLRRCDGCREEAARLERLRRLLSATLQAVPEPDWTGFWDGVRRRTLTASPAPWREAWGAGLWRPIRWSPRLALGGALAGLLLLSGVLWQVRPPGSPGLPRGVVVSAVETVHPDGNVMVFASPEDEMTVIWVFGLDQPADQSRLGPTLS